MARKERTITTQSTVSIKPANDEERAVATITMAFIADPIVRWFIHDSARYLKYWPPFVAFLRYPDEPPSSAGRFTRLVR